MLKVGDKVRVVRAGEYGSCWVSTLNEFINDGKIYTVKSTYKDSSVKFEEDAVGWNFPVESLELVKVAFKVGDKVKVVKSCDGKGFSWATGYEFMDKFIGQTMTVESSDSKYESVNFEEDRRSWNFPWASLELVDEKFIDGISVSVEEFTRRTVTPVEMTMEEIQEKLGFVVKIKQ